MWLHSTDNRWTSRDWQVHPTFRFFVSTSSKAQKGGRSRKATRQAEHRARLLVRLEEQKWQRSSKFAQLQRRCMYLETPLQTAQSHFKVIEEYLAATERELHEASKATSWASLEAEDRIALKTLPFSNEFRAETFDASFIRQLPTD